MLKEIFYPPAPLKAAAGPVGPAVVSQRPAPPPAAASPAAAPGTPRLPSPHTLPPAETWQLDPRPNHRRRAPRWTS